MDRGTRVSGQLLKSARGSIASAPITSQFQILTLMRGIGADGFRVEAGVLLALRWDLQGNEVIVERFLLTEVPG